MPLYTPTQLSKLIGVQPQTLRIWENNGTLQATKTKNGHRRYIYNEGQETKEKIKEQCGNVVYARVSSYKQSEDLQRQIKFLQSKFPDHTVIKDIGGGVNFQRKGLKTLLERAMSGTLKHVVVAHKDRLCRFGYELLEWLFNQYGVVLEVIENNETDDYGDITNDVLSVVTHFTAKLYGSRKYKSKGGKLQNTKNKDISLFRNEEIVLSMLRNVQILLQPNKCFFEETKEQETLSQPDNNEEIDNEE
jgi:putative resolvase